MNSENLSLRYIRVARLLSVIYSLYMYTMAQVGKSRLVICIGR